MTRYFLTRIILSFALCLVGIAGLSFAQTAADAVGSLVRPDGVSQEAVTQGRARLDNQTQLSAERKKSATAFYDAAEAALRTAESNLQDIARLKTVLVGAPARLEDLQDKIATLQEAPSADMDVEDMNAQTLSDLQQTLITKETNQRALRSRIADLSQELETLQAQRQAAPNEQSDALTRIKTLTETLASMGDAEATAVETAQRLSLEARLYMRRTQIALLEQQIVSFSDRQKLITANRDIAQLELSRLDEEVAALQRLTGQQRVIDAQATVNRALARREDVAGLHPMVEAYADGNVELAKRMGTIAQSASQLPKLTAETRSQVDIVDADLRTATLLIELGNLSRESAQTLRKLRNDTPSALSIRAEIKDINSRIAAATQARLLAQDQLRDFLPGELDIRVYKNDYLSRNPGAEPPTADDSRELEALHNRRRILYTEISNGASEYYDSLTTLKTVQQSLLESTEALNAQLDRNLLWLPSTAAIGLAWPGEVLGGALSTFSSANIQKAVAALLSAMGANIITVLVFALAIIATYAMRKTLWDDILRRSKMVGRVQMDNYWHTPAVLLACVIIALPLALIFALITLLFTLTDSADPFINALADAFGYLSVFTLFFLTWRAWDSDGSLFDAHFKVPKALRHAINRHLMWFIPVTGATSTLFLLTDESADRLVYEGLALAAFIATCLSLAMFSYLILWPNRRERDKGLSEDNILRRYRTATVVIGAGVPLLCAIAAGLGYFDTAVELMDRFFTSGLLIITTYVAHGILRRFIVVGKRRLALRQAIERRDKVVKAREEKAAAEERGETVSPPPVDYDTIDVETLSRQTAQLIYGAIILVFAVLAWMIWADLLPALSFFNGVELSSYMVDQIDSETGQAIRVERTITLWNVMQAIVIAGATFLAARNLPSFLEIFVLTRVGLDAGTRYAVVTILGYIIIAVGVFMTFDRLGLQWSELKFVVAGLSVGIGLGLQKIIANFVSGLIILFERPVRVGDYVTIGDQSGNVSRIQIRATTLIDLDNKEILIPNEELISQRVINWTLSNAMTRLIVPVGIAYGTDTEMAQTVMLDTVRSNPLVMDNPPAQVLFMGFGDSSLDFEVRAFLSCFEDRIPTRHALHTEINKALAKAGVSIPFPQRDLHIITPGPTPTAPAKPKAAPQAKTAKKTPPKAKPKPKPAAS